MSARLRLNRAIGLVVLLELMAIFVGAWLMTRVTFVALGDLLVPDWLRTIWNVDYSAILSSDYADLASPASSMRKYLWWVAILSCSLNVVIVLAYQMLLPRQATRVPAARKLAGIAFFSLLAMLAAYGVFLNEDILNIRGRGLALGNAQDGMWAGYMPLLVAVLVLASLYASNNILGAILGALNVGTLRSRRSSN